jgi:Ni,Fe-hydrogenase III small subunit/NAD-dependent dihydropyrimidine dehydrogenase PreA subunit
MIMDNKLLSTFRILQRQGKQYIPDLYQAQLPSSFMNGRVEFDTLSCADACNLCAVACPTQAIDLNPLTLDMGKCLFCGECKTVCPANKIIFTNDYRTATNQRNQLVISENATKSIRLNADDIRKEIKKIFGRSLKLRQVSAGGDNSCEWELNATENVNFDIGRYGINFVASPRHADGIVITGPISQNMAAPLESCYHAINEPKLIIVVGTDAISGGIFSQSEAINRSFFDKYKVDLYVPGNPPHPLTFITGVLDLIRTKIQN